MNNNFQKKEKQIMILLNEFISENIVHSDINFISIVKINLTNDYHEMIIYYEVSKNSKKLQNALNSIIPEIKRILAKNVKLKRVPVNIKFEFENALIKSNKVLDILNNLNKK